ncbi:MAG: choice-of-anchor V domain-containing protein [Bacteroidota bacterium]
MKRPQLLVILVFLFVTLTGAIVKINQAPVRRTNAPGEQSCGGCHAGNVNTGPGSVSLALPANGYVPGQTYTLTHDVTDATFNNVRFGFTTTALDGSDLKAGDFANLMGNNTSVQSSLVGGNTRAYMGHVQANSSNTWSYEWTAPASPVGDITFYTVSVVANGNSGTSGDNVYQETFTLSLSASYPQPAFTTNASSICESGDLSVTNTSTGTINTYAWDFGADATPQTSNAATPPDVSYSTPGTKTITLTASGPDGTETISETITVQEAPSVAFAVSQIEYCINDGSVNLGPTVTGGANPYQYSWSCDLPNCGLNDPSIAIPTATPGLEPLESITYFLTVTDDNGCQSALDSVAVLAQPSPMALAGPDASLCPLGPGEFLQASVLDSFGLAPFTYAWTPAAGLNDPTALLPFASPSQTTTYTLQVTGANGCASNLTDTAASLTVFVEPLAIADAGGDQTICAGDSLMLIASGGGVGFQFEWSGPGIIDPTLPSQSISPDSTSTYLLSIQTATGCAGRSDTITIFVGGAPDVVAGVDQSVCEGDSLALSASISGPDPEYSLQWSGGGFFTQPTSGTTLLVPDNSGQFVLTASSLAGCGSTSDTLNIDLLPAAQPTVAGVDTLLSSSGASYQWFFVDQVNDQLIGISGANQGSLVIDEALIADPNNQGLVLVEVTYDNGCARFSEAQSIDVLSTRGLDWLNSLEVFPNPAQTTVQIRYQLNQAAAGNIGLFDVRGKLLQSRVLTTATQGELSLDVSNVPPGIYLIQMEIGSQKVTRKLVVW